MYVQISAILRRRKRCKVIEFLFFVCIEIKKKSRNASLFERDFPKVQDMWELFVHIIKIRGCNEAEKLRSPKGTSRALTKCS